MRHPDRTLFARLRAFFARLKKTTTWGYAVAYGGGAIVVTQLIDPLDRAFGPFRDSSLQAGFVLLAAGFVVTVILAWHHGERGRQSATRGEILALMTVGCVTLLLIWAIPRDEIRAAPRLPDPQEFGIAVMPFEHAGHPDDLDRTRGIHAAVSTGLQSISSLTVIDHSSVTEFEGELPSATEAAALLGVRYLLFGLVQWADRVSVQTTVRLVDGVTNVQLGSWDIPARYDETADVFALQESIAGHVARAIQVEILPREAEALGAIPTADALAMDHFILGVADRGIVAHDATAMRNAIAHMERATERDPRYGEAWARLAYYRALAVQQHGRSFPDATQIMIEEALTSAERYATGAPETLLARAAHTYFRSRDWPAAERQLVRLTRRFPNSGEGHALLGFLLRRMDEWPRVIDELDAAATLDPRNYSTLVLTAEANHMVGRFDEALAYALRAEEVDPTLPNAPSIHALTLLWGLGDTVAAKAFLAEDHVEEGSSWRQVLHTIRGDYDKAIRVAEEMGRPPPFVLAALYAEVGNLATSRMWADSGREVLEGRLPLCPGPDVPSTCLQNTLNELALIHAIAGDTSLALDRATAARREHARFHEGLNSSPGQSQLALAYVFLGRWTDATREMRELLSRPSYMHARWLRIAPQFERLRANHPPFMALLDSVEAQGPLLPRLRRSR